MPDVIAKDLSSKVASDYKLENNTFSKEVDEFASVNKLEVAIGDEKQPDFLPRLKIKRWCNEVNFSIGVIDDHAAPTVETLEDRIIWKGDVEAHFYDKGDGYEFEVVLPELPKTNVLEFSIKTKGLVFHYQDVLTAEEIANGMSRPDNVVGSYAVYHESRSDHIIGGPNYGCGKAFHLYRPEAIDAAGTRVWCDLKIDVDKESLTITVPQDFLDKAIYPVIVDPTLGYTTIGGTNSTQYHDYAHCTQYAAPTANGDVSAIVWYGNRGASSTRNLKGVIWAQLDKTIVANSIAPSRSINSDSPQWWTLQYPTRPKLLSGVNYYVGSICDGSGSDHCVGKLDAIGSTLAYDDNGNNYTTPKALGTQAYGQYKYSVYAVINSARDYFSASKEAATVGGYLSDTVAVALTFLPKPNTAYLILASWLANGTGSSSDGCTSRLYNSTAAVEYQLRNEACGSSIYDGNLRAQGAFGIFASAASPVAQTISIRVSQSSGTGTAQISKCRIVAIALDSLDKYNESTGSLVVSSSTWTDKATTGAFTPQAAGDYLILAAADLILSAAGTSVGGARIDVDGTPHCAGLLNSAWSNDRRGWASALVVNLTAASHTIKCQFNSPAGNNTTVYNNRIIAIRLDNFTSAMWLHNGTRETTTTSADYVDESQPLNFINRPGYYLLIGSAILDNNSASNSLFHQLSLSAPAISLVTDQCRPVQAYASQLEPSFAIMLLPLSSVWKGMKHQFKATATATVGMDEQTLVAVMLAFTGARTKPKPMTSRTKPLVSPFRVKPLAR